MQALAPPHAVPIQPLPAGHPACTVVPGFLSPEECHALVAASEARGFQSAASDYPRSYRTNDRQVLDDDALAATLLARLRGLLPAQLQLDATSAVPWRPDSINARFRLCRYRPGQSFGLHQDGVHHRGAGLRSALTFMVYLTDGECFAGGDTVFHDGGPGTPAREIGRVRPRAGSLILFDHALWHAGETVTAGVKHVLRSDVLYRRDGAQDDPAAGHRGYVWALQALPGRRFASGGRDADIRVWTRDGACEATLRGHRRSVLGLAALGDGRLASVSRDRSLRVWDVAAARCVVEVPDAHAGTPLAVVALPDGRIATSGADGAIRLWTAAGVACGELERAPDWVWSLAPLPGGRLAAACEDGALRVWDLDSRRCAATWPGDVPLRCVAASADGARLVVGDVQGRLTHRVADAGRWRVDRVDAVHAAAVRGVRFVGAGPLASVGEDGRVRLSSIDGGVARELGVHANFATDVLEVGGRLVSCGYDGRIRSLELVP